MATRKDKDQELQDYLDGDSSLSRSYRQEGSEGPSSQIDDNILAAARREAKSKPHSVINPFGSQWMVPASLAAALVVAIGLVMTLEDETGMPLLEPEAVQEQVMEEDRIDVRKSVEGEAIRKKAPAARARKETKPASQLKPAADRAYQMEESETPAAAPVPSRLVAPKKKLRQQSESVAPAEGKASTAAGVAADKETTREQWLIQIKDLIQQGRQDEANKLIEQFRERFPDYPIDKELGLNSK